MTDFYLGQIVLTAFPGEMQGWLICDGRLLEIEHHPELFDLLGTEFGGMD